MSDLDWREEFESIGRLYAIAVVDGTLAEMAMAHAVGAPPFAAGLVGGAIAGAPLATRLGRRARPLSHSCRSAVVGSTDIARRAGQ